LLITICMREF